MSFKKTYGFLGLFLFIFGFILFCVKGINKETVTYSRFLCSFLIITSITVILKPTKLLYYYIKLGTPKLTIYKKIQIFLILTISINTVFFSIEYIIYLDKRDSYFEDPSVSKNYNVDLINNLNDQILKLDYKILKYSELINLIKKDSIYSVKKKSQTDKRYEEFELIVDTMQIIFFQRYGLSKFILQRSPNPVLFLDKENIEMRCANIGEVATLKYNYLKNKKEIIDGIYNSFSLNGKTIIEALNNNNLSYKNERSDKMSDLKSVENRGLSFLSFVFSIHLNNPEVQATSHIVKLMIFIQILISAFLYGYIIRLLYKILDREN